MGRAIPAKPRKMCDRLPEINPSATERARARMRALSRWENEGGARLASITVDAPPQRDTEADQLRIRVMALENLVIVLLADATDHQRTLARDMAGFISPRPGYTLHLLTRRAAKAMRSLLERAVGSAPASTPELRVGKSIMELEDCWRACCANARAARRSVAPDDPPCAASVR